MVIGFYEIHFSSRIGCDVKFRLKRWKLYKLPSSYFSMLELAKGFSKLIVLFHTMKVLLRLHLVMFNSYSKKHLVMLVAVSFWQ